ncbi:TPA: hypothetical protein DCZ39_01880 [Patescibacteria group bacterium]|nr:hypothetical protein [Candidatus Gracilibacteria bacterium]
MQKNKEIQILPNTPRLERELLSMKYVEEIFKELTDEVTKYLRVSTPKKIEQEEQWIINSKEKYEKETDVNFIVTDGAGDFI